jgi:hypothetical protein
VSAVLQLALLHSAKHVRGEAGGSPSKASGGWPWKGRIPGEHPAVRRLIPGGSARDSRKGQSLEVEGRRTGLRVSLAGDRGDLTAGGFGRRGNTAATLREGKAPKGRIPGTLSG